MNLLYCVKAINCPIESKIHHSLVKIKDKNVNFFTELENFYIIFNIFCLSNYCTSTASHQHFHYKLAKVPYFHWHHRNISPYLHLFHIIAQLLLTCKCRCVQTRLFVLMWNLYILYRLIDQLTEGLTDRISDWHTDTNTDFIPYKLIHTITANKSNFVQLWKCRIDKTFQTWVYL